MEDLLSWKRWKKEVCNMKSAHASDNEDERMVLIEVLGK